MSSVSTRSGSRTISRRTFALATGGTALTALAGCLGDNGDGDRGDIATAMPALWDFTQQISGDHYEAFDVIPTGEHGHDYEADSGDIRAIENAEVFVYMRDFAGWIDDFVAEHEADDSIQLIDASAGIEFFDSPAEDNDEHWWMDPLECQNGVENIADGLAEFDPDHAEAFAANAEAYNERLEDIHETFEEIVEQAQITQLVVATHDSFQWWNRRYGVDIDSPIGTSPDGEASASDIEEIETLIEAEDVQHVLYDVGEPAQLAESLADETDAEVLPLSPVETQIDGTPAIGDLEMSADWGYVDHYEEINFPSLEAALQAEYVPNRHDSSTPPDA